MIVFYNTEHGDLRYKRFQTHEDAIDFIKANNITGYLCHTTEYNSLYVRSYVAGLDCDLSGS